MTTVSGTKASHNKLINKSYIKFDLVPRNLESNRLFQYLWVLSENISWFVVIMSFKCVMIIQTAPGHFCRSVVNADTFYNSPAPHRLFLRRLKQKIDLPVQWLLKYGCKTVFTYSPNSAKVVPANWQKISLGRFRAKMQICTSCAALQFTFFKRKL